MDWAGPALDKAMEAQMKQHALARALMGQQQANPFASLQNMGPGIGQPIADPREKWKQSLFNPGIGNFAPQLGPVGWTNEADTKY